MHLRPNSEKLGKRQRRRFDECRKMTNDFAFFTAAKNLIFLNILLHRQTEEMFDDTGISETK